MKISRNAKFEVMRNAQTKGDWGIEEHEGPFPFRKGEGFDLVILNEPVALQVAFGIFLGNLGDIDQISSAIPIILFSI